MKKKERVLLVLDQVKVGGVVFINLYLHHVLKKNGYDVEILNLLKSNIDHTHKIEHQSNIKIILYKNTSRSIKKNCQSLLKIIEDYEIIFFSESMEMRFIAPALSKNKIVINIVHNPYEVLFKDVSLNSKSVDHFVCVSPNILELLYLKGVSKHASIIPNVTSFKRYFEFQKINNRVAIKITYIGRFSDYHKGIAILPEIAELLKQKKYFVKWLLIGYGEEEKELRSKFEKTNVDFEIKEANHKEIEFYLNESDFSIIPSRFEAFGLTVIESMACGCIPICSNLSVFSWILGPFSEDLQVSENKPIEYVKKIEYLLQQKNINRIRENLIARQKKYFSIEKFSYGYINLLTHLKNNRVETVRDSNLIIPFKEYIKNTICGKIYIYLKNKFTMK